MAEKKTEERPEQIRIQSAIEMTPWERGTALGLLAFGAAPMVMAWIRLFTQPFELKAWVDLSILGLFTFISIETISLIGSMNFTQGPNGLAEMLSAGCL